MQPQPNYCVDGHTFPNEESDLAGDGEFPPFRVFDIAAQDYVPDIHPTREAAQAVADQLNRRPITPHAITGDADDNYADDHQLAWVYPAKPEDAAAIMALPSGGFDNRSDWVWLRLRDGTLMLGVFPQGDTYMEYSDAGVAPFGN